MLAWLGRRQSRTIFWQVCCSFVGALFVGGYWATDRQARRGSAPVTSLMQGTLRSEFEAPGPQGGKTPVVKHVLGPIMRRRCPPATNRHQLHLQPRAVSGHTHTHCLSRVDPQGFARGSWALGLPLPFARKESPRASRSSQDGPEDDLMPGLVLGYSSTEQVRGPCSCHPHLFCLPPPGVPFLLSPHFRCMFLPSHVVVSSPSVRRSRC
jgi:hypothetical protein